MQRRHPYHAAAARLSHIAKACVLAALDALGEGLLAASPGRHAETRRRARARADQPGQCLCDEEHAAIAAVAALIVPSGEDAPGANEMDVLGAPAVERIDALVAKSAAGRRLYLRGLVALDEIAAKRHGARFAQLDTAQQLELLVTLRGRRQAYRPGSLRGKVAARLRRVLDMASGWGPAIALYPQLRDDALKVFYSSEVAWTWLGYDGPPMPLGYARLDEQRARQRHAPAPVMRSAHRAPMIPRADAADVVVIGCGAGGAVIAKELAEAGISVVVLEVGRRYDPQSDYLTDRHDFELVAGGVFAPKDERRDLYTTGGPRAFGYNRAKGVGGSTLHYEAMSPRLHEADFRVRSLDGVAEDWPLQYADLEPFYTRIEHELGVSGPDGANPFEPPRSRPYPNPPHPFNLAGQAIRRGADKLGLHMVREPLAIPTRDWQGRPACVGAGTCHFGCLISAKSSMDVTYVRKAEASGKAEIRAESMATEIELDAHGKARGVVYIDASGARQRVRARAVVLAGNAVETARLLLLNASSRFPHGLANSSGLVGRYFTEHLAVFARGQFDQRVDPWRGTPTGGMIQDHYATQARNGFARGWTVVVANDWQLPYSVACRVPGWGHEHKKRVRELFGHELRVASIGEQLPDVRNCVELDPVVRDSFGLPVPRLFNQPGANDIAMISAIRLNLASLLEASGATHTDGNEHVPGGSSHYFGTCRMGHDPERSVVDAWCRCHDVPNLFVGDGSVLVTGGAVNPALTISALALRTAEGIIASFARGEL